MASEVGDADIEAWAEETDGKNRRSGYVGAAESGHSLTVSRYCLRLSLTLVSTCYGKLTHS